ncbi:MAG: hypothetical protein ACRELC_06705, partial [Gemmatimonadota bacterium]
MPERMLVVSDLHLNVGLDAETVTYDRRENFLADTAFADWLGFYGDDATGRDPDEATGRGGTPGTLVIAGDAFDFIRIDLHPESAEEYRVWAERLRRLGDVEHAERIDRLANVP